MKLQGITFGGNVSLGQAGDPNQAAREYAERNDNLQKGFSLLGEIAQAKTESDVLSSSARTAAQLSDFERRNAGKAMYTADEVRAIYDDLGVESIPGLTLTEDVDGEVIDRKFISPEEVYPIALDMKSRQIIDNNADTISNPKAREEWVNEANKRRDDIVTKVTLDARENIQQANLDRQKAEVAEYAAQGHVESARLIVKGMRIPDQDKAAMEQQLDEMQEEQINRDLALSGDVVLMEARLEQMTSEDYRSSMKWDDPNEYDAQVSYLKTSLNAAKKAQDAAATDAYNMKRDFAYREVSKAGPLEAYGMAQEFIAEGNFKKEDVSSLLKLAESVSSPSITQPDVYQMLIDQQMYDPEAFIEGSLLHANYSGLSKADAQYFDKQRVTMQKDAVNGTNKATSAIMTENQTIKQTQLRLGVYESNPKKGQAERMLVVDRYVRQQINVWRENNPGKAITDTELNRISDSATGMVEVVEYDPLMGTDWLNPDSKYDISDIPVEDFERITADWKRVGISPSGKDILDAYAKEQKAK